jgi:hypothetical protein
MPDRKKLMTSSSRTVFVLGAGFTKSFLPTAPLLLDDYSDDELAVEVKPLRHAYRLLELELKMVNGAVVPAKRLNLERLMTRLHSRMPYDYDVLAATREMDVLLSKLKRRFRIKLEAAKPVVSPQKEVLGALAKYCVTHGINCITFNYDDVLDAALWAFNPKLASGSPRWGPNGGYGFFCRPSEECVRNPPTLKWVTSMRLLKLHGSLNWRVKKGQPKPYGFDAIMHHEEWFEQVELADSFGGSKTSLAEIEPYLEPEPFMVPPVLAKADLVEQPILRLLWTQAYSVLKEATTVTFVGYSLPITDIAAGTLFREALDGRRPTDIKVVDFAPSGKEKEKQEQLLSTYSSIFPGITAAEFDLRGGLEWAKELVAS